MDIGKLNKRVQLQKRSATLDDYGQPLNAWVTQAEVWANIKPISGKEKLRAMAVESVLSHTITVRYRQELLPPAQLDAWRIVYITKSMQRIFNINAAMDIDEAHEYLVLDVTEGSLTGGA
jgi:SPP1 family predicted phage head-tail adaptor